VATYRFVAIVCVSHAVKERDAAALLSTCQQLCRRDDTLDHEAVWSVARSSSSAQSNAKKKSKQMIYHDYYKQK